MSNDLRSSRLSEAEAGVIIAYRTNTLDWCKEKV